MSASPAREPLFPYMFWAHREAVRSRWCLSQSGMPAPDAPRWAAWTADAGLERLEHPEAEAAPRLRARLAEMFGVPERRVLLVPGASGGMFLCAMRWFRAGARVAAETPSYEPLRALPRFFGAELALLERRPTAGSLLQVEDARAALAGHRGPGHLFVTNSHNPTGSLLDGARIRALAREAERAGGVLVSCEVYMEFAEPEVSGVPPGSGVPGESPGPGVPGVTPGKRVHAALLAPNAVSIGSLTKAYGLGPLRVGWIVLGEGLEAERDVLLDLAYLGWVDPPAPSLWAALAALDHLGELRERLHRMEHEQRPILLRWLEATPGVDGAAPGLGLTVFPRIEGVADTRALSRFLQAEHEVDVVPGEFFAASGHLRIGCGLPPDVLEEGLARLARGIDAFRAKSPAQRS